jgi:hypothetical protein
MFEGATREQTVHSQHPAGLGIPFKELRERSSIQAWNPNDSRQPANGEHHEREKDAGLELGDLETITEGIGNGG